MIQEYFGWILTGLMAIVSWFTRDLLAKHRELERTVNNLHEVYVRKDDFRDFKDELWKRLDRLEETIRK